MQQGQVSSSRYAGCPCLSRRRCAHGIPRCRRWRLGFPREHRPVPPLPARDLRRRHRAGARDRAAHAGAAHRPGQPRLPVQRPARLRQDDQRAHPGPLPQLRAGPDRRARAATATRAWRWPAAAPASVDVIEIDAASHGGVDDARDLRERASYGPAQSRYKIYIIDEAHMVTPQGFNALLKIVEEPPEHVKFVFATTEPEKVIGTIRSRTHHYPFRLVPPARAAGLHGASCATREGVAVAPGVLSLRRPGRRRLGARLALGARPAHRRLGAPRA